MVVRSSWPRRLSKRMRCHPGLTMASRSAAERGGYYGGIQDSRRFFRLLRPLSSRFYLIFLPSFGLFQPSVIVGFKKPHLFEASGDIYR